MSKAFLTKSELSTKTDGRFSYDKLERNDFVKKSELIYLPYVNQTALSKYGANDFVVDDDIVVLAADTNVTISFSLGTGVAQIQVLITNGGSLLYATDITTKTKAFTIPSGSEVHWAAFSADGYTMAGESSGDFTATANKSISTSARTSPIGMNYPPCGRCNSSMTFENCYKSYKDSGTIIYKHVAGGSISSASVTGVMTPSTDVSTTAPTSIITIDLNDV